MQPTFRIAVLWSFALNGGRNGILLVLTFVLATLLGPHDFGTVAMATAYLLIAEMLLELGLAPALVQRRDLRDEHLDSAFWVVVGWSLLLMGVSAGLAPWWADLNELPVLREVIWALGFALPLHGLALVQQSLFQRSLDFRSLAIRSNIAAFVAGGASLAAALSGWGVWALVLQRLTMGTASLLILWWMSPWRPRLRYDPTAARELMGFSFGALLARIGVFATTRADALIMGLFFGPVAVGIYQLGHRLVKFLLDLTTRSIQPVALADFSRLQSDPAALSRAVGRCIHISASIAVPALTVLALSVGTLVPILGEEWLPAAAPAVLLCLMGIPRATTVFVGPIIRALGRPYLDAAMMWAFAVPTLLSLVGVAWWVGEASPRDQAASIALSRVLLAALLVLPVSVLVVRRLLPSARFVQPMGRALLASMLGAALCLALDAAGLLPDGPAHWAGPLRAFVATVVVYGLLFALDAEVRSWVRAFSGRLGMTRPGVAPRVVPPIEDHSDV